MVESIAEYNNRTEELRPEIKKTQNGYIAMKSYFDPVLERNTINKKTKEIIVSNLTLQDESIILYDNYDKINSLHIYANFQRN